MTHLFRLWRRIEPELERRPVLLFLDFDGTLTPIAIHPGAVSIPARLKSVLSRLALLSSVTPVIVSGRSLADLGKKIAVRGIIYAGNHGMELRGPGVRLFKPVGSESRSDMKEICRRLKKSCASLPGILVEDKKYTLSVHYRKLRPRQIISARRIFRQVVTPYLKKKKIKITSGKKVWEIRPPVTWNKGSVVLWILGQVRRTDKNFLPVFVGDDKTDEDAFRVVKGAGMGVKVAERPRDRSSAFYFLKNPGEVLEFLKRLIKLKKKADYDIH